MQFPSATSRVAQHQEICQREHYQQREAYFTSSHLQSELRDEQRLLEELLFARYLEVLAQVNVMRSL